MTRLEQIIRTEKRINRAFYSLLFIIIVVTALFLVENYANAKDETALRLVQCIRAECSDCEKYPDEPAAIAWVLKKQAVMQARRKKGWTILKQIKAYCAMFDKRSERQIAIWSSTFDRQCDRKHTGKPEWWERMKVWSYRFLNGEIADPEPRAIHWGGNMDIPRMKRAGFCVVAKKLNTFWGVCVR